MVQHTLTIVSQKEKLSRELSMSTGKSTEKAMHMMTHTSLLVKHGFLSNFQIVGGDAGDIGHEQRLVVMAARADS